MNNETSRYDLSLYTREPWIYIGFNHLEQSNESFEALQKSKNKNSNNFQVNENNPNKLMVGKKRNQSTAINEFINKESTKKIKLDTVTNTKIQINETKTIIRKKSQITKINSNLQISSETIDTIKSPRKIILRDEEKNPKYTKSKDSITVKDFIRNKSLKFELNNFEKKNDDSKKENSYSSKEVITKLPATRGSLLENEIFNQGIDVDFRPKKKDEIILKQAIEKFNSSYIKFLDDKRFFPVTKKIDPEMFSKISSRLFNLYKFIKDNGGIENVIGYNLLQKFISESRLFPDVSSAKQEYDNYLYHYSIFIDDKEKLTDEMVHEICERDSSVLLDCPIITAYEGDSDDIINEKIRDALKYDMVILRGFLKKFLLNNSIFSIEYLEKNCDLKNYIDVIEQEKNFFGFFPNRHSRRRSHLGDYLKYVNSQEKPKESANNSKNSKILKDIPNSKGSSKEKLLYGVNIELTEYMPLLKELESKIHPLLLFGSSFDSLAFVRNHIKGMTIPQMYIKVPGVWTGGHEENLRMRSINICHGPGVSYWWASPTLDSKKLVDKVKEEHNINIYKKEGIWFPNIEFFLKNRIKVFYTVQEAGDIVLVGPGTIHWVRAKDHSINTSWNFSVKEVFDMKCSMERYEINKEIKIRSLVPMKTLILDILNFEMFNLNLDYVKTCSDYLIPTINESIISLNSVREEFQKENGKYNLGIFKEDEMYMVENCEVCLHEIFNLWAFCQICSKAKEQYIVCINCFRSHIKQCYNPKFQFIFYKYEASDLQRFVERLSFRLKFDNQMESKDLIEPQKALQKNTKDTKSISEKMKFKTIQTENYAHLQNFNYLYKNIEVNQISSMLIPLLDPEKLSSQDFRMPLKSSYELFLDPYIEFDDLYYEESNKQRFSPPYKRSNSYKDNHYQNNFISLGDEYQLNEINSNIIEINSITGKQKSLNNSIKMSPKFSQRDFVNNISYPVKNNFNSNLPGKTFFEEVEDSDVFDIRSYKGLSKNDIISQSKFITPSSPKGSSNILSLVSDIQNMRQLKNDLNVLNSPQNENIINNPDSEYIINEGDFCVMDVFNGLFSSSKRNGERENSNDLKTSIEEIKIAKSLLHDLTLKEAVTKYKFISKIHSNIWKGKEILSKYIGNKEVCGLTNLMPFVEKIISNSFLITKYREIFKKDIYDKMK